MWFEKPKVKKMLCKKKKKSQTIEFLYNINLKSFWFYILKCQMFKRDLLSGRLYISYSCAKTISEKKNIQKN